MTVAELLERITSAEITEWIAHDELTEWERRKAQHEAEHDMRTA